MPIAPTADPATRTYLAKFSLPEADWHALIAESPRLIPGEALALTDVLAAFTAGSAWVSHLEGVSGTIEVGKAADLVVLDRDLYAERPERIGDARVLLTCVEGAAVHEDPELEAGRA